MTIEEQVVNKLIDRGFRISFAESCTGGLCCGTLVNVSNASKVLDMSFVTYANEAKVELINVSPETIKNYGVVSEQVAGEMCIGVAEKAHSDVGVGVTGVAGPTGGTAKKTGRYGLLWILCKRKSKNLYNAVWQSRQKCCQSQVG